MALSPLAANVQRIEKKKGWVLLLKQGSAGQRLECLHKTSLFGFGKMAATVQEASSATDDSGK
jgi:hypothetical protein